MADTLSYDTISKVITSWEQARQIYGSDEKIGNDILQRLFELEPETKTIYGFDKNADMRNNGLLRMGLLVHGQKMVHMLDSALALLGPDFDTMESILSQLGPRHAKLGVKVSHFGALGKALREALSEILLNSNKSAVHKPDWNDELDRSWEQVFDTLSGVIVSNMIN